MQGLLLIDKPAGWTSFDVVNKVRFEVARLENVKPKSIKVGHAGTLDPFATGLLIVLVGKEYTRQAQKYSKQDKTYAVSMVLGKASSTGDPEGELTDMSASVPSEREVLEALDKFRSEIWQTPHPFSAIKVGGQRAYKLARAGKEANIEPRKVTISKLELIEYTYPQIKLVAEVSSGTYIRSLVEDIGKTLEVGAYTAELRRTKIGEFDIQEAKTLDMTLQGIRQN